ncbi:MAG TPA: bifunctional serine/threonine-protein kinase/formylglycine-generating enzyme family protein [Labilithrix sp.]
MSESRPGMPGDKDDALKLVGTTIAEKYAIESVVGQGGFATVYRATHTIWQRPVAVKVFKALGDVAADQRQKLLDDFNREGALLAELSERSTAIVQARDVGSLTTPGGDVVPYMVLEWLEGKTLEDVLEHERAASTPLRSMQEAIHLLDPVADALALAHKKGIVHRDVKPANVFVLGPDPRQPAGVKLLDFGIAKVVQDAQKMGFGKTAGQITSFTPLYGAPEQFNRAYGATSPATDVFALALVLGQVVSGNEPMPGDTIVQLAYASADPNKRPTPRALGVATSDEVEAIFQKALAVSPADRYATVGEFWSALKMLVTGERMSVLGSSQPNPGGTVPIAGAATVVDPIPLGSTMPKPQKKGGAAAAIGVAVAVVVLGGGALAAWKLRGAHPPSDGTITVTSASASATAPPASASAIAASDCPKGMIAIPGGEFFMGSDEKDALPFEKPAHRVKLSPYCLDELEVTVAQYKECSDRGACRRASKENEWPGIKPAQRKIYDPLCNIQDAKAKAQHPINCVDWEQAKDFCEAHGARLPTEAEWELAARGPDGRIYPWGDDPPSGHLLNACDKECLAWMKAHPDPENPPASMFEDDDGFATTAPVGSFPKGKSRYGVQDVVGNVWEWTADWYGDYVKSDAPVVDPTGPKAGTERVIRGGAWNGAQPSWVRPSFRYHVAPADRGYAFGFRCAKSR